MSYKSCKVESGLEGKFALLIGRTINTLSNHLGIEFTELSLRRVVATMPVDSRTKQPFGLLHGGASLALAETIASVGGFLHAESGKSVVGVDLTGHHVRSVKDDGLVIGTGTPLHIGRKLHLWEISIVNSDGTLVSTARCSLMVVDALLSSVK